MNRKTKTLVLLLGVLLLASPLFAGDFPPRPKPPRLVNDLTGNFLSPQERNQLESTLEQFARETSTQIAIAIVPDLHGYDPSDYAQRLAEQWGIGQKDKNNGMLILVKPKTAAGKGKVFIATGYGVEGAVPDAIAKRIVEAEIIPEFKKGNYYAGLNKAVTRLMELTRGEYTAEEYARRISKKENDDILAFFVSLLFLFFIFFGGHRRRRHATMGRNVPFWTLFFLGGAGRSGGSFSDFSSGSGGFGGFGGFGGGSFGGGGAGGSW